MKIRWIDGKRLIPGVGELNTGDERVIPDDIARALIRQGQAERVVKKSKKGGEG